MARLCGGVSGRRKAVPDVYRDGVRGCAGYFAALGRFWRVLRRFFVCWGSVGGIVGGVASAALVSVSALLVDLL